MSDLISRQDALKPFCIAPDGTRIPEVDCDNFPVEFSVAFIKKHLLSLPSAEPETKCVAQIRINRDDIEDLVNEKVNEIVEKMKEPKTGHWIFNPKDAIELMFTLPKCSECGFESSDCRNFCSNCGARMNGG